MAASPRWKVYRDGEYVASFKYLEDAACLVDGHLWRGIMYELGLPAEHENTISRTRVVTHLKKGQHA